MPTTILVTETTAAQANTWGKRETKETLKLHTTAIMRTNNRGRYRIRKRNEHNVEIITTETN